jgi:DNA-binding transcriptional LysR family regulator
MGMGGQQEMRNGLDLNLLPVLAALDDHRSVSGAAVQLGMTQPQVSVALGKLRDFFHDPLFIRTGHQMRPTPRAVALVQSARQILEQVRQELSPDIEFDPALTRRPINLALSDAGEVVFLPRLFAALSRAAPNAVVHSHSPSVKDIGPALEAGEIDLAIGYLPDLHRSNFFQQTLLSDGFATLIRADHPMAARRLTMQEYIQLDHAVVRSMLRSQEVVEQELARRRVKRRIRLIIPHVTSLPILVAQSDLLVTVPGTVAHYFAGLGENVRMVSVPLQLPTIDLKQHWHRRYHDDLRNRWLRQIVAAAFQHWDTADSFAPDRRRARTGMTSAATA